MKIEYEKVDELSDGHGVLFIHTAIDKPIAFLVGYKWLHGEPSKIKVEILPENHLYKEYPTLDIDNIIYETQKGIRLFIKNKGSKKVYFRGNRVRVWYNA
jgi:hypothetical protein